jgi:hypothetical protein
MTFGKKIEMTHRQKIQCLIFGLFAFASSTSAQNEIEVLVVWNAFVRSAAAKNPDFIVELMARGENPPTKVTFDVPSERRLAFWRSLQGRVTGVNKSDLGMNFFLTDGLDDLMKDHGISAIGVTLLEDGRVVVRIYGTENKWLGDLTYEQKSVAAEAAYLKASLTEVNNKKPNKAEMATPRKPSD